MAKSKTKIATSRGQAAAKASAATKKAASSNPSEAAQPKAPSKSAATAPASSDIRQAYKKSLLGKYLGTHRGQPAIKPKK